MNVLILGCGNIGALYDWESDEIKTYAKAFHSLGLKLSLYDTDPQKSKIVAERYNARALRRWDEVPPNTFDIVVISTPTPTHFYYLFFLLSNPPGLIICEKPIDSDFDRLEKLVLLYKKSKAKVMVNYHRRFQPKILELSQCIQKIIEKDHCQTVVVNYQRGFHNNASHAIDLLTFLFAKKFTPSNVNIINSVPDEFFEDPTMSLACHWSGMQVLFVGLVNSRFSQLEVALYFPEYAIMLKKGCDEVEFLSTPERSANFYPVLQSNEIWSGALRDHMLNVARHAQRLLIEPSLQDNFLESIEVSNTIDLIMKRV
jgi:hypothetical protein